MPTVAERLAQTANNSLSMPNSGRSTPVQSSSGRSTPTNLILSPTKSTMSNEELFAAIHKSKKRLNIKEDNENSSPYGSTNSLVKMISGSGNSWSSESQKTSVCRNMKNCLIWLIYNIYILNYLEVKSINSISYHYNFII